MRLRLAGIILLLVVGIAAVVIVVVNPGGSSASTSATYRTAAATKQDVTKAIVATGTVTPVSIYSLAFGSAATTQTSTSSSSSGNNSGSGTTWKVTAVNVAPGKAVKAGDVLATADTASAQLALTLAQANLTSAQQKLATDQGGLSANDKAAAQLSVTQASQSLTQANQSYSSTVAQNKLKLSQQLASLNAAKAKLAADQAVLPPLPAATITQDESGVANAQNSYDSLKLQVAQSNQQASNQVTSAQNQLTSAKLGYATKTAGATAAQVASDQAAVATAQQSVDNANVALANASLTSPADGVILTVNITAGVNAPSGAAITMQSAAFQVSASVAEADLPLVKLGQDATITMTASGLTASGKVTQISPSGSSGSGGGVVTYAILVSLPTPPAGTASGMSAQISVTIASVTGVIAVPTVALVGSAGSYSVRVLDSAGQPQLVSVTVGLISSSYAEIQSGVDVGTAVVVGTSSTRQGTTNSGGFGGGGIGVPGVGGGGQFRGNGGG